MLEPDIGLPTLLPELERHAESAGRRARDGSHSSFRAHFSPVPGLPGLRAIARPRLRFLLDGIERAGFAERALELRGDHWRRWLCKIMLLLLDNYDSFTYNLFHYLGELGAEVVVRRNDALSVEEALVLRPQAIVISPGPCDPDRAGISVDLVQGAAGICPILGVCLGHQAIAQAFGGRIVRAPEIMHGKLSAIEHAGDGLFRDLPSPFTATRYHSLVAEPASLPSCLEVTARTADGVIMAVRHRELPIHGVQFHPESIETAHGHRLLGNFLALVPPQGSA
jgi:anthranilate synthase component 2